MSVICFAERPASAAEFRLFPGRPSRLKSGAVRGAHPGPVAAPDRACRLHRPREGRSRKGKRNGDAILFLFSFMK